MFKFIKKFFGFDKETLADAGVKLKGEECPYKIEPPAVPVPQKPQGQTKKPNRRPRNRKPRVPKEPVSK